MRSFLLVVLSILCAGVVVPAPVPSVARVWNEEILAAIRIDLPHPPVHARNLFHLSVAMYDAWAVYDHVAVGCLYHKKHVATDSVSARREAISYAAYRILRERYALSRNAATTLAALDARMTALGYDKNNFSLDSSTAVGVGNRVAGAVSSFFLEDGALQLRAYADLPADQGGYVSVNPPLSAGTSGTSAIDVNRWQPLIVANAFSQNGLPIPSLQSFVGAQWIGVRPFALARAEGTQFWIDPGPPPLLGGGSDAEFRNQVVGVIRRSSELTPDDGVVIDISPGVFGNNSLGFDDGAGHTVNPTTSLPYPPNRVKRGDFARVLSEYWADGPSSETPPGHWNSLANSVTDHALFSKRFEGTGPVLDDLEWDVKLYLTLNAALHDAACAAWSLKRHYDGWRPITAIRYMGQLGQSSEPQNPSYHPNGLPLVPGLIERVTTETSRPGGRHVGLPVDAVVILAWAGHPVNPANQHGGVRWILPSEWLPYQRKTFVTPAFPGYISGHSTFSRSAAEVLAAFTGSPFFPVGLGTHEIPAGMFLSFESGPSQSMQLQWATYFDAADQAGLARQWGGIHPSADDLPGRKVGAQCGRGAWALARQYFDGSVARTPSMLEVKPLNSGECEIRCSAIRGLFYKLQSTTDLLKPFTDEPGGYVRALDSTITRTAALTGQARFFRYMKSTEP